MGQFTDAKFKEWSDWLQRAQQGERKAYESFLSECYPFVERVVARKVGGFSDKEDVVQECLIGIHKSLATYNPSRPLKPWILTIIKFKICDYFRRLEKKAKETPLNEEIDVTNSVTAENTIIEGEEMKRWQGLLASIPENLREAIMMTKVHGLSYKEAAAKTNVTEVALRKRISRAYSQLSKRARKMELQDVE